ncbi:MAG: terminase small subunit, partial [Bdellovibrionota bacterium]
MARRKPQKKAKLTQTGDTSLVLDEPGQLTDQQELFVREYLVDLNGTQAAIRAGYSENTAQEQSSRLLSKAILKQRVESGLREKFARIDMTAERVLLELFRMATVDVSEAYDESGMLKAMKDIPADVRKCITGIDVSEIFHPVDKDH